MAKFLTLACFCFIVCACKLTADLKTHPIAGPGQVLNFENYCSDSQNGEGAYWHSYAFFEASDPHQIASLGIISVGWGQGLARKLSRGFP